MERDTFEIIADIAMEQFDSDPKGLRLFLSVGDDMLSFFEDKARIKCALKGEAPFISQNERNFHLIGFMDAICWLQSLGYISLPKDEAEQDNPDDEPWLVELLAAGMTCAQVVEAVVSDNIAKK